jgi:23S rRNA (cytidine1920-2'-O)/16S rRNA (cytidine1409-2'-O)-methyltransferase
MAMESIRLDKALVLRGLCPSRTQAQRMLEEGLVLVNGVLEGQGKRLVSEHDEIALTEPIRYVSRGGLKLEGALEAFGISPEGRVCLDVGASTGGFTDCLLQRGAAHVLAIDVGTEQFTPSLLASGRVTLHEKTHVRDLPTFSKAALEQLKQPVSLVVVDVSFISLLKVFPPILAFLENQQTLWVEEASSAGPVAIVALMKPQFEYGEIFPDKPFTDVVSDAQERDTLLLELQSRLVRVCEASHQASKHSWRFAGSADSVLTGPAGNHERFLFLTKD